MDTDFPAAHSMDTTWYAVDQQGNIGVFFSAEGGPVPEGSWSGPNPFGPGNLRETGYFHMAVLAQLRGQSLPAADQQNEFDWGSWRLEMVDLGVFLFEYVEWEGGFLAPYKAKTPLWIRPPQPFHIDQGPPAVRQFLGRIRFERVDFSQIEHLQVVEHVKCYLWEANEDVAYLSDDRHTLKPLPSKKERFAEWIRDFCERRPELAKNFTFEGVDRPPPPSSQE